MDTKNTPFPNIQEKPAGKILNVSRKIISYIVDQKKKKNTQHQTKSLTIIINQYYFPI